MILLVLLASMLRAAPSGNLLPHDLAQWEKLIIGAPTEFSIDKEVHHSGAQTLRIDAKETARSYWRSGIVEVAPGETIHAGAWVKLRDVPQNQGTVIVIGEFTNSQGHNLQVEKFGTADPKNPDWQHVEGKLKVPEGATHLRLRLGFSYCKGTVWWDDAHVEAEQPIVMRIDLNDARLSRALDGIPVVILNRPGSKDMARVDVTLGNQAASRSMKLTGAPVQRAVIPILVGAAGKRDLSAELYVRDANEPTFVDKRKVMVPPPIALEPPVPTHWAVEDGPATIGGEVDLSVSKETLTSASLDISLLDSDGKVVAEMGHLRKKPLVDGLNHFEFVTQQLPEGEYKIRAVLSAEQGEPVIAEYPWHIIPRRLARVTINPDGYCVYDGNAIFPIGIYNGGAHVKEMGEAGFTVNHAYNAANAEFGEKPNDIGAVNFLDASEKNGMKVCFLIPRGQVFHGDWDALRHRVRLLRNHPALLCWDEEEGIARGDIPPESLAKLRQIIREEDPNHPLMVGDSRDLIGRVPDRANFFPVDQMDMGMWWWYPLPLKTGATTSSALEGEEATNKPELAPPNFLTKRNTGKPIWVGIQAYKKKDSRYPTPAEMRAQAYLSIIHGAQGVMWYGGSVTGGIYLDPKEGHWDDLKRLARELRDLSPLFMTKSVEAPTFEPADAPISVCRKRLDGRDVVIAVNRGLQPVDVRFTLSDVGASQVRLISEDRRLSISFGQLQDHFEPLAAHVYELTGK